MDRVTDGQTNRLADGQGHIYTPPQLMLKKLNTDFKLMHVY